MVSGRHFVHFDPRRNVISGRLLYLHFSTFAMQVWWALVLRNADVLKKVLISYRVFKPAFHFEIKVKLF